jgi:predicted alpha/beta-hydrolase family hydrolase
VTKCPATTGLSFTPAESPADVSAILDRPASARALLVLGHGAGAGMRHPFMNAIVRALSPYGVATFRYQFPYMEQKRRRPDPRRILVSTARAAVDAAREAAPDLPIFAGGKSMGGRMTSLAAAEAPLPGVRGLVFLGFPLHAARSPSRSRADHLAEVGLPMLFLQGTRDPLAPIDSIRAVVGDLGSLATLHVVEGGDHSFHVLKRSGRAEDEVHAEVAEAVAQWMGA